MRPASEPDLAGQTRGDLLIGQHAYRGPPEELADVVRAYGKAGFSDVQVWLNPGSVLGIEALAPVLALLDDAGGQSASQFV